MHEIVDPEKFILEPEDWKVFNEVSTAEIAKWLLEQSALAAQALR